MQSWHVSKVARVGLPVETCHVAGVRATKHTCSSHNIMPIYVHTIHYVVGEGY